MGNHGFGISIKPVSGVCNLRCQYCFYLEKTETLNKPKIMDLNVLNKFIREYIELQPQEIVEFVWHGGEPALAGIDFYEAAIKLQQKYKRNKTIRNNIQTNGTLIDDKWCKFLSKNNFFVGLSIDGPRDVHDHYRKTKSGNGTFDSVFNSIELLKKHGIEFNALACVTKESVKNPLEIYEFFRENAVTFIQFSPVVERMPSDNEKKDSFRLGTPSARTENIMPFCISSEEYGIFLTTIYDYWVRNDVGKMFVMNFEWALSSFMGNPSVTCIHAEKCGDNLILETDGSVYFCDHLAYSEYYMGNVMENSLAQIRAGEFSNATRMAEKELAEKCKQCAYLSMCNGGCPKHRFLQNDGNYLCGGYHYFFSHIEKYNIAFTQLLTNGYDAETIMEAFKGPLVINAVARSPK